MKSDFKSKLGKNQLANLIYFISFCLILLSLYRYRHFYHDDAFISLKYAKNFIDGNGLVWNIGERVEGYTNLFFILCIAGFGKLGIDLQLASQILGFLGFAAILIFYFKFTNKIELDSLSKALGFFLISTCQTLIVWSYGGLETVFYSALVLYLFYLLYLNLEHNNRNTLTIYLVLLITYLTRPDNVIFLFAITIYFIYNSIKVKDWLSVLDIFFNFALVFFLPMIWRYYYYGDILPNTFYAKSGFTLAVLKQGFIYTEFFFISNLSFIIVALLLLTNLFTKREAPLTKFALLLSINILLLFTYVIYIGGDHMPAFRFVAPVIPLFIILFFYVNKLNNYKLRSYLLVSVIVITIAQNLYNPNNYKKAEIMDWAAYSGKCVANEINKTFRKNSLIAINGAGAIAYFAPDFNYIDMLGLNDRTIAKRKYIPKNRIADSLTSLIGHTKGDGKYVLSRKPDYIILGPSAGTKASNPWFLSDYEISLEKEFYDNYRLVETKFNVLESFDFIQKNQYLEFYYYERINNNK